VQPRCGLSERSISRSTHDPRRQGVAPGVLGLGDASVAICGVNELARQRQANAQASELLLELRAAHVQLRALFAEGLDDAVCALAGDVMELASCTTHVLNQDQGPSGS
jgi:hypothetical protein